MLTRTLNEKSYLFENIISWSEFSDYINNDRAVSGLQAILPGGKKLCMEKYNLYRKKKPAWAKKDAYYDKEYLQKIMQIKIKSNIKKFTKRLNKFQRKQIPFATAGMLNDLANDVRNNAIKRAFPEAFEDTKRAERFARGILRKKFAKKTLHLSICSTF